MGKKNGSQKQIPVERAPLLVVCERPERKSVEMPRSRSAASNKESQRKSQESARKARKFLSAYTK